jgi:SnoaL-like domain
MPDVSSERDPEVQELLDKQAIRELMIRYCRGLDRMDAELISSVYHPDAHDDHGGRTFSGADIGKSILDWTRELNVEMGSHHITNETIRVDGDTAACESYYSGFMLECHDDGQRTIQMVGRYLDRLERRNGEWKISERVIVAEMFRYLPSGTESSAPHWHLEARQDPDPSYALLAGR